MNYQKLINQNIKNLRLDKKMTQEEFAEKILISTQGLSNIERNRYQPTAQTIDTICRVFKISPLELLIEKSDEKEEIIKNISLLLMSCSKTRLKKIYKIVAELSKF